MSLYREDMGGWKVRFCSQTTLYKCQAKYKYKFLATGINIGETANGSLTPLW